MAAPLFEFTKKFARGIGQVDAVKGVLRGVTVAEVGDATGWFAYLNPAGDVLGVGSHGDIADYVPPVRRVQLAMDARSLETIIEAAKLTPRVRAREDHDDGVGARAGFAANFRMEEGRLVCDQTIFDSYRHRAVLFETADESPELIGLSGDFAFVTEVIGDRAFMRVSQVRAVDIVDQGALTHAGLFSVKKARAVDSGEEGKAKQTAAMSTNSSATVDLKAFREMCKAVQAHRAEHADATAEIDECLAGLVTKPAAGAAGTAPAGDAAAAGNVAATMAALKTSLTAELTAAFKAEVATVTAAVTAEAGKVAKAEVVELHKQMGALGIKVGDAPGASADGASKTGGTTGGANGANGNGGVTDFLTMKAGVAAERKIKPSEAAAIVMREHPKVFRDYQIKLGIIKETD